MWILPSYNRPEQCAEVVKTLIEKQCSTWVMILVNGEKMQKEYNQALRPYLTSNFSVNCFRENIGVCGALQQMFYVFPNEPFYGLICDDEFIKTEQWDAKLIEAAGKWNLAHANNGDTSKVNPHGFMTFGGELVRAVGCIAPRGLWHWYFDAFWEAIAKRCGVLRFCPDVELVELHHKRGTAPVDDTYCAGESRKDEDRAVFEAWLTDTGPRGLAAICERVRHGLKQVEE